MSNTPIVDNGIRLYDGICLKRETAMKTTPGDAIVTAKGLYYYKRSFFRKAKDSKPCDFFVSATDVAEIKESVKNMNNVMELHMKDGSVLEFYSPDFDKMLDAMKKAVEN